MRWRLTLTYVALLAVLLAGFGAYQYISLRQSLIASRVASLQDDMTTARAVLARAAANTARGRVLCTTQPGVILVARTVATTVAATSGHTVAVIVYDSALQVAAQAPPATDLPRLDPSGLQRALDGERSNPDVVSGATGDDQLVVGFPIRAGVSAGTVCGVAQLSTSMSPQDRVLGDELTLLAAGGAAALLIALIAGVLLTSRALRPLQRLTATAQRLAGGDLRARSGVESRHDEIGVLARSFDEMAARIEESFAAQQASEERTRRFIADASHELRTPVTALKGYIDVIRRGATRDAQALDAALEAMAKEAERMRLLVLDLLTLARVDARQASAPELIDLGAAVADHLDEGVPGMPERLERQLQPDVLARIDRNALATIVRNLLVNACQYAPGAAQSWRTRVVGDRAVIEVEDQGPGIADADLAHLFERFYRGEKTRAREEGGSGLGLSIVQGLARAAGGDVAIASAEGHGTTVTVWFPRGAPASPPEPPPPPVAPSLG
ncbi:MAG TPA: HAMP domain-containing sensor histidine kinase [Candidatus Dormibacteraeota bacterium]|nr:HAMP domain-containing sensor histidine kinase [Candidatus Dormibacteraeota bacterium]